MWIQCYCIHVTTPVKGESAPRTRRASKAEQTRRRILDAAMALFSTSGYAATTIDAIARRADVAVETVYSRFGSKAAILDAILGPAIVGTHDAVALADLPELVEIGQTTDQREQLRLLARVSRGVLERTDQVHLILRNAAASDSNAAALQRADTERRRRGQSAYIDLLIANGPLRDAITASAAADTYAALANPMTYDFLTVDCGWTPDAYEAWLADTLTRALLP
jgi:AcrR family transcriptional regulator